jgi:choline dehydrogenase-like flavoprotein
VTVVAIDGGSVARALTLDCDVVVVGSGPGGASAARSLAAAGADVIVVEEGREVSTGELTRDPLACLSGLYAGGGFDLAGGRSPMQMLRGNVLGGTSFVNSAICWPLPRDVYDEWIAEDPALAGALPWDTLESATAEIEEAIGVAPTDPGVAGPNNLLMASGADRLGLAHQPTRRNVRGCQGLGRCSSGCPIHAKRSADQSLLPLAAAGGARIVSNVRVEEIVRSGATATGVAGRAAGGGRVRVRAARAVVLAAGAIGSPLLLLRNRIRHGPVGLRLQGHPGVAVAGRFDQPVDAWQGATQGHEITGLMDDGIKLESLTFDLALIAYRAESVGSQLAADAGELSHWATWAAGIRTAAMGSVAPRRRGARVRLDLTATDMIRVRRAVRALGEVMFAAGAVAVVPGAAGWHRRVHDAATMARFEDEGPLDSRAYSLALSHMFGTCRMGTDRATSVVGGDFRHHTVDRLYVADASVFPTNTGVNPQIAIMAMGACCARAMGAGAVAATSA